MNRALKHIVSLLMAFLVMFSTVSFTVDKHFCGSHLVDKAVFSKAKTCGMHMDAQTENQCCTNKKISVEGQDELKISFDSFDFHQQVFLATYVYTYINLFENLPEQVIPFKDYSPPLLVRDIHLVDQVFLI